MYSIGLQEKFNHVRILLQMAKSDGFVNIAELTYIIWVSQKLGISKEDLNELAEEEGNFSAPFLDRDRSKLLYEIIKMMYVDGQILETEVQLFRELANKLSTQNSKIEQITEYLNSNPSKLMEQSVFDEILD